MTQQTISTIQSLFKEKIEELDPIFIHLSHQLDLPIQRRIVEIPEDELADQVKTLRISLTNLQKAENDFEVFLIQITHDNT